MEWKISIVRGRVWMLPLSGNYWEGEADRISAKIACNDSDMYNPYLPSITDEEVSDFI